jgi:hypothetical protein
MIRRINLMGGAGCGKSTTANYIRAKLSFKGLDVELVDEQIKDWTYYGRSPKSCDSFVLQGRQMEKEDIRLRAGVDFIISDSPLFLQYFYACYHKAPMTSPMLMASQEFDKMYEPLHIFVDREDKFYNEVGRYEKLAEAKEIDTLIQAMMVGNGIPFVNFSCLEQDNMVDYIMEMIKIE